MKYTFLLFYVASIGLFSCGSNTNISDKPPESILITYTNGKIFCKGIHRVNNNGKKNRMGLWMFYFPNGNVKEDIEYNKFGAYLKRKIYSDSGKLVYEGTWRKPSHKLTENSILRFCYPNSKLKSIEEYDSTGNLILDQNYDEEGSLLYSHIGSKFLSNTTYYYKNGKIKSETVIHYDKYENITSKDQTRYWSNGIKKEFVPYNKSEINGTEMRWDSTGKLLLKVKYEDGIIVR